MAREKEPVPVKVLNEKRVRNEKEKNMLPYLVGYLVHGQWLCSRGRRRRSARLGDV